MIKKKAIARLAVLVSVICLFVSATAVNGIGAEPTLSVRIGLPQFYSNGLFAVATENNFWDKEGIKVNLVEFGGAPQVNEALIGGSVDIAHGGVGPAIALISRTSKVVVLTGDAYADSTSPPELLVVAKDSPIQNIKQLDGKKVAVHAKGTLSHILLEKLKIKFGINPIILEIPAPSQWAALSRGDIDGAMNETPYPEQMKFLGARYLYGFPDNETVPYLAITLTHTTRDFAEKNPEALSRVLKVMARTARWMMDNPEKTREIIGNKLKYKQEVVSLIHPNSFKWSRNLSHMIPSVRWWGRAMKDLKIINQEPDYGQFFVTSYVDSALKDVEKVPDPDFDKAIRMPLE